MLSCVVRAATSQLVSGTVMRHVLNVWLRVRDIGEDDLSDGIPTGLDYAEPGFQIL